MKINKNYITTWMLFALLFIQTTVVAKTNSKQSNVLAEIGFLKDMGLILLPVAIGGKQYNFFLDTGASYNFYDLSLKKYLGSSLGKMSAGTSSGKVNVSMFKSSEAKLGSLSLKTKEPVGCYDLRKLSFVVGRRMCGIIGMSFLKKYAFKIDFDKSKVVFYKTLNNLCIKGYSAFPLRYDYKGNSWLRALIPGGDFWFLIDTGDNSNGSLAKILFNSLLKRNKITHLNSTLFASLNKTSLGREGLLSFFSLGSFEDDKLRFSSSIRSRIGLSYLSRYFVLFDFPNKKLYLKKRLSYRKPILCKTGLSIGRKKGETLVYSVDKDSPASRGGFKKGDLLLSVDDENSNKFTLYLLRRFLKKPGQVLQLKVSRKGKIMKLQLKPETY